MFRYVCVFISVIMLGLSSAFAQTIEDVYVIDDIKIYYEAENLQDAKMRAEEEAISKAFNILMNRILPRVSVWKVQLIEPEKIQKSALVATPTFERKTTETYMATFSVSFNSEKIRAILNKVGAVYYDKPAPQSLVIPIVDRGLKSIVWDNNIPELAAWNEAPIHLGISNFTYAEGDLMDIVLFSPDQSFEKPYAYFKDILDKYEAEQVILIKSSIHENEVINHIKLVKEDESIDFMVASEYDQENPDMSLNKNINEILQTIDDNYKGLIKSSRHNKYTSNLIIKKDMSDASDVIKRLNMIKSIVNIQTIQDNDKELRITVIYVSKPIKFISDLKQVELIIQNTVNGDQELLVR